MAETYLFYSSLTMFAMDCLTLVLSILFRLKHQRTNSLPRNLSANVFDKTFNVFNPYPERRRIVHNFSLALPLMPLLPLLASFLFFWTVLESGLLLSLILLIICLNLILIEGASEIYQNANIFIKAFNKKADLGVGDLKVFQVVKRALPKLSNYYLALSILFVTLAATSGYIWSSLLWFFAQVIGLILEVSTLTGTIGFYVVVILFVSMVVVVQVFIQKIKSKFLSNLLGTQL